MIIFPYSFVLSAAAAGYPLTYPRIGYQTYGFDLLPSAITVSGETTDGPKDAPLRPDTAEFWEPAALPATWIADLGSQLPVDYVGIAGHTLGSSGASVEIRLSPDGDFDRYILLPGTNNNYITTPDSAAVSVTGDIDIRVKVALDDYTPGGLVSLVYKQSLASLWSYWFHIDSAGKLNLLTSPDGTANSTGVSSVAVGLANGAIIWLRVTRVSATGVIKFYTSNDGVTWSQLGTDSSNTAGAIFNSADPLRIGQASGGNNLAGRVYYAEIRNGIAGTVGVAWNAEDAVTADDTTVISSATGEVWTILRNGSPSSTIVMRTIGNAVAPADDTPIMFLDESEVARYVQLRLTGSVIPRIAVIYMGEALVMERKNTGSGFTPVNLSRQTVLNRSLSRSGQFLGQGFRRNGVVGSASFLYLDPAWYRTSFDPFVQHARRYPYFFGWCPEEHPEEIGYVWTEKDIAGGYMGDPQWMQVQWAMSGIGNG